MDIGEPERTIRIVPVEEPVPEAMPLPTSQPLPVEVPDDAPIPTPNAPEKVNREWHSPAPRPRPGVVARSEAVR
jgi:hypothetical protein